MFPCALGFEIKHLKLFCRSFRTCLIILSMGFTVNIFFGHGSKVDWDFLITDLVKNPDATDI